MTEIDERKKKLLELRSGEHIEKHTLNAEPSINARNALEQAYKKAIETLNPAGVTDARNRASKPAQADNTSTNQSTEQS